MFELNPNLSDSIYVRIVMGEVVSVVDLKPDLSDSILCDSRGGRGVCLIPP
jgi:hypothetical protein